jgi:hypothetical protein
MNKRALLITVIIVFVTSAFAVISGFSQEDVTTVRDSAFGVRMRPEVPFMHEAHNEKAGLDECAECHHEGFDKNGAPLEGDPSTECSACHMKDGKNKMDLMRIYHLNCKGCHENRKAGPVMCGECHKK